MSQQLVSPSVTLFYFQMGSRALGRQGLGGAEGGKSHNFGDSWTSYPTLVA